MQTLRRAASQFPNRPESCLGPDAATGVDCILKKSSLADSIKPVIEAKCDTRRCCACNHRRPSEADVVYADVVSVVRRGGCWCSCAWATVKSVPPSGIWRSLCIPIFPEYCCCHFLISCRQLRTFGIISLLEVNRCQFRIGSNAN